MHPNILWLIVGVEGFVALAAQMLTIRQLMPFVGNNVIVTSLIIGFFLLALAIGYWEGGRVEEDAVKRLIRNFSASGLWLGVGLSYIFLAYWFFMGAKIVTGNLYFLLMAYLLIVTVPPVFWLGQTVPIIMNLWKEKLRVGAIGGRVLQLSTFGSFLGAVLTSVILINFFGLGWTVFATSSLLLVLAWLLSLKKEQWVVTSLALVIFMSFLFWLNVFATQKIFVATNNYGQYQVFNDIDVDKHQGKMLVINNSASSFVSADGKAFPYIERIKKIVFDDMHLRDQSILVLGAGGFSFSAENAYGNHVTYVDVDPAIEEIVKKHYLTHINGNFIGADARVFVQNTTEQYPAIIIDVYSNQTTIPAHLLTVEFFAAVNKVLTTHGVAIFNVVANAMLTDPYSQAIDSGLRAVFKNCVIFPQDYENAAINIVYACQKNDGLDLKKLLMEPQAKYYTDDRNRATWDQQYLLRSK
jgi:predicted membrane-bound spermidine synthase